MNAVKPKYAKKNKTSRQKDNNRKKGKNKIYVEQKTKQNHIEVTGAITATTTTTMNRKTNSK